MKAIIPIGGRGTRMRPVTFTANKHFIPVGNKLLIEYPIETMVDAGITDIAITYNPGQLEFAQKILNNGSQWGAKFTYILQPEPKGLANVYQVCEDYIKNDHFVVHLGDNIFTQGIKEQVNCFIKEKPNGMVVMVEHPENWRLGVPYFDKQGNLTKYLEKPKNPPHKFAVPGLYFFDSHAFTVFKGKDKLKPSARGEYEMPDAYQWLIDHGYNITVKEYHGKWLDPGKFGDWLETNRYLLDTQTKTSFNSQPDKNSHIQGRVTIGKNCQIKNTTIRGPVNIGNHITIMDSFIGPFTAIYHGCHLLNCKIDNSVLMDNVILKDITKPIDNSIIGPDSQITGNSNGHASLELFIGEMSKISL